MMVKKETRILGIDDAPFNKFSDKKVLVVGTVYRGGSYMDGVISCYVDVDGNDSTDSLISLINKTKHKSQLQVIMLKGIALGGFNIVDIKRLNKKTKLPVIVVMRKKPNFLDIRKAIQNVNDHDKKWKLIKKAGKIEKILNLYVQSAGIEKDKIKDIINITCIHGNIPEPLRVAHLVASGIILGESRGRA